MDHQLITFKTAKLANEKGFKEMTIPTIYIGKGVIWDYVIHGSCSNYDYIVAPTQSQLQRWLREEHDIKLCVSWIENKVDDISYYLYEVNHKQHSVGGYDSYEETLEDGLQYALKLIN